MTTQSIGTGVSVRALEPAAMAFVLGICAIWGFNQVAVKLAMPDFPPLMQGLIRAVVGTVIVGAIAWMRGVDFTLRDGTLAAGIGAGLLFGIEFVLIYRGLVWTTASRATLFIYLMPVLVVIGMRFVTPGDRFSAAQWAGLALAFAGIIVAFGVPGPSADPYQMLGDAMMVAAAFLWAATTILIKATNLNHARFEKALLYQLVVSIPVFALGVFAFGESIAPNPSAVAVASIAYQSVFVVGVTFLVWFALIQRYSASRLSSFTFLTPLFGVLFGHFILGDPLTFGFGIAVVCVLAGLYLVNRPAKRTGLTPP